MLTEKKKKKERCCSNTTFWNGKNLAKKDTLKWAEWNNWVVWAWVAFPAPHLLLQSLLAALQKGSFRMLLKNYSCNSLLLQLIHSGTSNKLLVFEGQSMTLACKEVKLTQYVNVKLVLWKAWLIVPVLVHKSLTIFLLFHDRRQSPNDWDGI